MKEFVGVSKERIQFLQNLNLKKNWEIELENVTKELQEKEFSQDISWRLMVLEWNGFTRDNLNYFLRVNDSRDKLQWYHAINNSNYSGNLLLLNQVYKDLKSEDSLVVSMALKFASFGVDDSWLDLKQDIEKEMENPMVEIRKDATRAYFGICRLGRGDYNKILRKLVDSNPLVMNVGLIGIKEFSIFNVEIQQGLMHILKQIKDEIVQIRILQLLENFKLTEKDLKYLCIDSKLPNVSLEVVYHVNRVLFSQRIYDLNDLKEYLESRNERLERMGLMLMMMMPIDEKKKFTEQVYTLKNSNGILVKRFSFRILSEVGSLKDLYDFFGFFQEFKEILPHAEVMENIRNWIRRDFSDFDKFKGFMTCIRLLEDKNRLECFDQALILFESIIISMEESLLCFLDDEINVNNRELETNISRIYMTLLEKFKVDDLLIKILVDCVLKCSDVVIQEHFVSLIRVKTQDDFKKYLGQIQRLAELETKDELVLNVFFNI